MKKIKFVTEETEVCFIALAYMFSNVEARKRYNEFLLDHEVEYPNINLDIISKMIVKYDNEEENMFLNFETVKELKGCDLVNEIQDYTDNNTIAEVYYKRFNEKLKENIDKCTDIPLIQYWDSKQAFIGYTNGNLRALINSNDEYKFAMWNGKAWNKLTEEECGVEYGNFIEKCYSDLTKSINTLSKEDYRANQKKINIWDSKTKVSEALGKIKRDKNRIINLKNHKKDSNIICSKNGIIIDFNTGTTRESCRNDFILNTSRYNLVSQEEAEKFVTDKFKEYENVLGIDRLNFLFDLIAYKMLGKSLQKAIFMIGGGATGKSTFKNIIKDLFEDNITNIPYEYFTLNHRGNEDKSRDDLLVSLNNKLFGVSSEGEEDYQISQAKFKTILSNSTETARPTRGNLIEINLQRLDLLVDTNEVPRFGGNFDDAVSRRLLFVKFINKIPMDKRNANFYREQIKPYFDYVFSFFVYRSLGMRNKEFIVPKIIKSDTNENIEEMDSLLKFFNEKVLAFDEYTVDCEEFEKRYEQFCIYENIVNSVPEKIRNTPKGYSFIADKLKEYSGNENIRRNRVGKQTKRYVFKGILLNQEGI